ncbi:hypothetical protein [Marinobacterium rhizophilum]|uniref:hypothetical protein n=1 Tax=Marinobacterium rhizophilum TaxID=420402 RepID=UPI00196A0C85|nr:hypothetical protein [Marinobacterium rhizophilum]
MSNTVTQERDGESIYSFYCSACHDSGITGAPKFGDGEMKMRMDEKGLDVLV